MRELLDLEGLIRGGSWSVWLMVFLLVVVFLLVRLVTDVRKEVTAVKDEAAHTVSEAFLQRFTELNNARQLQRIRDAYRRAYAKDGSGRYDLEIQKEIDQIRGAEEADDGDLARPRDQDPAAAAPPHGIPEEHNDF